MSTIYSILHSLLINTHTHTKNTFESISSHFESMSLSVLNCHFGFVQTMSDRRIIEELKVRKLHFAFFSCSLFFLVKTLTK